MAVLRKCHRCAHEFDGGNSVGASCPKCGTLVFDVDTRPTLIPESYGPGEIVGGEASPPVAPPAPTPADPQARTVALGPKDVHVPSDLHFPPVTRIGHYDILGEIARGGMGVVYRARDTKLNRLVALKVLLEGQHASQENVERFLREAQSTARLRHPSIVPIYDMGVHDGRNYLVMEYIVGQPLSSLVHAREMTPARAVDLMVQVADAVEHAHREGIVHRDIKPANILVDTEWRAKVTDFGLAKAAKGGSDLTKSGTAMGTPYYMPPEQARGETRSVDQRSDVYAMGAVLFECLAGRPPFVGETDIDTILKVVNDDPPRMKALGADVAADLEHVCLKCLDKSPEHRYQSARELADELRRFRSGEGVLVRGSSPMMRLFRHARRHRALLAAGFVGFAAAVTLFGIFRLGRNIHDTRRPAGTTVATTRPRPAVPFYEAKDVAWSGEGWRLGDSDGAEAWEVSSSSKRRLSASGAHDGAMQVEFTIRFDASDPADLTLRLLGHPNERDQGYSVEFSRAGRVLRIVADRRNGPRPLHEIARVEMTQPWTPVLVERRIDGLWVWAGGGPTPVIQMFDPAPGFKRESREVSLTSEGGALRVGSLRLSGESAAYRRHPVGVGDRMFELQAWDIAGEQYRFAAPDDPRTPLDWEAHHRAALCRLQEAELSDSADAWRAAADGFARVRRETRDTVSWWAASHALALAVSHLNDTEAYADALPAPALVASLAPNARPESYTQRSESPVELLLALGKTFAEATDPAEAARAFRKEIADCPHRPDFHCAATLASLTEMQYQQALYSDSEKSARELLVLVEELAAVQRDKGLHDYGQKKNRHGKEDEVRRLAETYGTPPMVAELRKRYREVLARSVAASGRWLEAVALIDAWLGEVPDGSLAVRAPLLMTQADLHRASGAWAEAITLYAELAASSNETYGGLAARDLMRTHLAAGDIPAARAAIDEAAKKRPRWAAAFEYDRGLIAIAEGQAAVAKSHFLRVASLPQADLGIAEMCRFISGTGKQRALELALARVTGGKALIDYLTGLQQEVAGKPREAIGHYRRAVERSIGFEQPWLMARMRLEALQK